jgi:hypothetical protein
MNTHRLPNVLTTKMRGTLRDGFQLKADASGGRYL